jgi:hypothetical protein
MIGFEYHARGVRVQTGLNDLLNKVGLQSGMFGPQVHIYIYVHICIYIYEYTYI